MEGERGPLIAESRLSPAPSKPDRQVGPASGFPVIVVSKVTGGYHNDDGPYGRLGTTVWSVVPVLIGPRNPPLSSPVSLWIAYLDDVSSTVPSLSHSLDRYRWLRPWSPVVCESCAPWPNFG